MKSILVAFTIFTASLAFGQSTTLDPENIPSPRPLCAGQSVGIYEYIGFTANNSIPVEILSITSSNDAVIDDASLGYYVDPLTGPVTYFYVYGDAGIAGTTQLTFEVANGIDTVLITAPAVEVVAIAEPVFNTSLIELCTNQGIVNFNDYLTYSGNGVFYNNSLEIDFPNGLFDTGNSPFDPEEDYELTFQSNGICEYYVDVELIVHNSPTVTISKTGTACGQSTGTATANISGGELPYGMTQWSSGQQNTNAVTGLAAGQYEFTVSDANSCQVINYFTIVPTGAAVTAALQNVSCFGASTGAISLAPSGLVAPVTALWSTGHSTTGLTGVPAGNYTVQLTDAAGCILTKTYTLTQPDAITSRFYQYDPNCGASDGSIEVEYTDGGVAPYSYAWSNGDTGSSATNIAAGIYSLTTTDNNGCTAITTFYVSELGAAGLSGAITGTNCGAAEGAIDVYPSLSPGQSVSSISWSNGATTEDISNLAPANYICTLITSDNCKAIKGWNIPIVKPLKNEICVVTVDDSTTTNLVVWERVQTQGIAWYNIYRETSVQGNFALIDTVEATNISLFNDVVASPLARSWRYKISAVNGCGVEGPLSEPHRTIHLDVIDQSGSSVTVNWNPYEGAAFSNYVVSRYTDAAGWEEIATLPNTQLSHADNTPFATPGLDYVVEIVLDEMCTALVYRAQDFNASRSNKDKGAFSAGNGTGDSHNSLEEQYLSAVSIHPNPTTGQLIITQESGEKITIEIRSVEGQLIRSLSTSQLTETLNIEELSNGIYFITVGMNATQQTTRIVKQ